MESHKIILQKSRRSEGSVVISKKEMEESFKKSKESDFLISIKRASFNHTPWYKNFWNRFKKFFSL